MLFEETNDLFLAMSFPFHVVFLGSISPSQTNISNPPVFGERANYSPQDDLDHQSGDDCVRHSKCAQIHEGGKKARQKTITLGLPNVIASPLRKSEPEVGCATESER